MNSVGFGRCNTRVLSGTDVEGNKEIIPLRFVRRITELPEGKGIKVSLTPNGQIDNQETIKIKQPQIGDISKVLKLDLQS